MAEDEAGWLPTPPPPRPARRDASIDAALRKFDGEGEAVAPPRPNPAQPVWRRPQFAVAMSAMLLVIVGIPVALIGIRNQEAPPPAQPAPMAQHMPPEAPPAPEGEPAASADAAVPEARNATPETPAAPAEQRAAPLGFAANSQPTAERDEPTATAAPPPPSPPPPPPPPPPPAPAPEIASADTAAQEATASGELIVTGSRIRQSDLSHRASPARVRGPEKTRPDMREYQVFLSRLQRAVGANDRSAIMRLISFPLRVNYKGGSRSYRDARAVERDFDRIFTPQVRRAVLGQKPDQLFTRDIGAMVGEGELWFDRSAPGEVRIIAVNP